MHLNIFVESWVTALCSLEDEYFSCKLSQLTSDLLFLSRFLRLRPGRRRRPDGRDGRDGAGGSPHEPRPGGGCPQPGRLGTHRQPPGWRGRTRCWTRCRPGRRRPRRLSHSDLLPGHRGPGPDHRGQLGSQQRLGRVPGLGRQPGG